MKITFPSKRVTIDFTPKVYLRQRTHSYLLLREKNGKGYFLNLESGSIDVIAVDITETPDGKEYWVYLPSDGASDKAYIGYLLEPYHYDFMKAVKSLWNSTLSKSVAADRELRNLLGIKPGEAVVDSKRGAVCSLADICLELALEPSEARKFLRKAKIEKPGERWEWEDLEEAEKIRELLRGIKPD